MQQGCSQGKDVNDAVPDCDVIPCIPFIPVKKGFKTFNRDKGDAGDTTVDEPFPVQTFLSLILPTLHGKEVLRIMASLLLRLAAYTSLDGQHCEQKIFIDFKPEKRGFLCVPLCPPW